MQYRQMLYHPEFECSSRLLHEGRIPGGYVVKDATGQALASVYARETRLLAPHHQGLETAVCFWNRYWLVTA